METKTVYRIALRYAGSNLNPEPSWAAGGRMMSKTVMSPMNKGSGIAPSRLGLQPGGLCSPGVGKRPLPVMSGSGMFLFVFPKGESPVASGFFYKGLMGGSCHDPLVVSEGR